jgi:anti-sigma B factor antagonist
MADDRTAGYTGDFSVHARAGGATLELILGGELDMATAFRLESSFDDLVAGGDVRSVVLDLADVRLVDSAGVGALLSMRERAAELDVDLTLSRLSNPVRRILEVTGLSDTFRT